MSLLLLFHPKVSSGTTVSGDYSASATLVGTLTGASIAQADFSASGAISGTAVGASIAQADLSASATISGTAVSVAIPQAEFSAAASGVFQATGVTIAQAEFSASAQIISQFIGIDANATVVVAAAMSAAATFSGAWSGLGVGGTDWPRVSGNNRIMDDDEEIAEMISALIPVVLSHRGVGRSAFSCSSSRVRSPTTQVFIH